MISTRDAIDKLGKPVCYLELAICKCILSHYAAAGKDPPDIDVVISGGKVRIITCDSAGVEELMTCCENCYILGLLSLPYIINISQRSFDL